MGFGHSLLNLQMDGAVIHCFSAQCYLSVFSTLISLDIAEFVFSQLSSFLLPLYIFSQPYLAVHLSTPFANNKIKFLSKVCYKIVLSFFSHETFYKSRDL